MTARCTVCIILDQPELIAKDMFGCLIWPGKSLRCTIHKLDSGLWYPTADNLDAHRQKPLDKTCLQVFRSYFTLARYRPQAGAIRGAAVTVFASRILSTASKVFTSMHHHES